MSAEPITLTIRQFGPDHKLQVTLPTDLPLSELHGDFMDVAEEIAKDQRLAFDPSGDWTLQLPNGRQVNGQSLDELGVRELAFYDASRVDPPYVPPAGEENPESPPPVTPPAAATKTPRPTETPEDGTAQSELPSALAPASAWDEAHEVPTAPRTPESYQRPASRTSHSRIDDSPAVSDENWAEHAQATGQGLERFQSPVQKSTARSLTAGPSQASSSRGRTKVTSRSRRRPVRARAEEVLPERIGSAGRILRALSALSGGYAGEDLGLSDPARFAREHRKPAAGRVREAWDQSNYLRRLEAMVQEPGPPTCQTVAVLSPKGGVGKTTVTGLLGMLLAYIRRTVTVAVDANPDLSNLSLKLSPGRGKLIDDLLRSSLADGMPSTPMEVLGELGSGPHGLRVAPSPNDPSRALTKEQYLRLYTRLKAVAEVLVLDCGTGLFDPPAQAAIETANQLVVALDGKPDSMALVASKECQMLLRSFDGPVFLAVNRLTARDRRRINFGAFEEELSFAQGIVELSYHEVAAEKMSAFRWDGRPPQSWAVSIRELAALITATWPSSERGGW